MNWSNCGFGDGLLGRDCQAPKNWRDGQKYLQGYLYGKQKRKELDITLVIERKEHESYRT